jgi:hypothetical protein
MNPVLSMMALAKIAPASHALLREDSVRRLRPFFSHQFAVCTTQSI